METTPELPRPKPNLKKLLALLVVLIATPIVLLFIKNLSLPANQKETFKIAESSPKTYDNAFPAVGEPTIVFTKKVGISENNLSNYFSIKPEVPGSWHLEKNGQVVYFSSDKKGDTTFPKSLDYNTIYTITIDKSFRSSDGEKLAENSVIRFKTKQDPVFTFSASYKLIATHPNEKFEATFNNYGADPNAPKGYPDFSNLSITYYQATVDQLLDYLTYTKDGKPLYGFSKDAPSVQIPQPKTPAYSPQNTTDTTFGINLTPLTNTGLVYVKVKGANVNDDFFVLASNHISQEFVGEGVMHLWTTTSDGKSLGNIKVKTYSLQDTPKLLNTIQTDGKGLAKLTKNVGDIDLIVSENGSSDIAIAKTEAFVQATRDDLLSYSYTDKPVYRPGDTVHYKAIVRKRDNGSLAVPTDKLYVKLQSNYSQPEQDSDYQELSLDQNGTVTTDIKLPQSLIGAYPQIILATKQQNTKTKKDEFVSLDYHELNVSSYRKPDLEVTGTSDKKEYVSLDTAHFTVLAKTLYGTPLANVDFSYRLVVDEYSEQKDRSFESDYTSGISYGNSKDLSQGNGTFDSTGKAEITIPLELRNYEQSQIGTLEITPKLGAAPSIGQIVRLIHRGTFAIFFEDVQAASGSGVTGVVQALDQGNPRKQVGNQTLTLALSKVTYEGTSNTPQKTLVDKKDVKTDALGNANFSFEKDKVSEGSYELVGTGTDSRGNTVTSRYSLFVSAGANPTSSQTYTEVTLKTDKEKYNPGETATVTIATTTPIKDALIIKTIHSDLSRGGYRAPNAKILSVEVVSPPSGPWKVSVPIPKDQTASMELYVFAIANGTVVTANTSLVVTADSKKLKTQVSFDKKVVSPGDTITATLTTLDSDDRPISADTSLSVFDKALTQIQQSSGDVFTTFYSGYAYSYLAYYDSTRGIATEQSGGGGGCFLEGTPILMSDGTEKPIEQVGVGDSILTKTSELTNTLGSDNVVKTYRHMVSEYLTINGTLNVTPIHRVFLNGEWQEISRANIGDYLLDEHGNHVAITSIVRHTGSFAVYNLTTQTYHTFFAQGIYVHNEKGGPGRSNFVDTAYWNPHIKTDQNGRATVTFKVPDNLTTFTGLAVANTTTQFGQTTQTFIAQKDVAIIPAIPNFYYQGDKPNLSLLIQNSSDKNISGTLTTTVKEINFEKKEPVEISAGNLKQIAASPTLSATTDKLSMTFTLTDSKGTVIDKVELTKPLLPKGVNTSSWTSFTGAKKLTFSPPFANLDQNSLSLSVFAHPAVTLIHDGYSLYNNGSYSSDFGQRLYTASYILAKTQDGTLPPHLFAYATLRNDFRETINSVLQINITGQDLPWLDSAYQNGQDLQTSLWILQAVKYADSLGLLASIHNPQTLLGSAETIIKDYVLRSGPSLSAPTPQVSPSEPQPTGYPEPIAVPTPLHASAFDQILAYWILDITPTNVEPDDPMYLAVKTLKAQGSNLNTLKAKAVPSASDRLIWKEETTVSEPLIAMAFVERGTKDQGDQAIKGLAVVTGGYPSPLALLAGLKHAVARKFAFTQPTVNVTVDSQLIYQLKPTDEIVYNALNFYQIVSLRTNTKMTHTVEVTTQGSLPIYTTIASTQYETAQQSGNPLAFLKPIQEFFGGTNTIAKTLTNTPITRTLKNIQTGHDINEIPVGETGMVVLTFQNPYTTLVSQDYTTLYSVFGADSISPAYMYLDQVSGNSSQNQNQLDMIFGGSTTYSDTNYISPQDFSDEVVFWNTSIPNGKIINLPYVVYNVSGGTYYQPKTSLVFPNLGVILQEK